MHHLRNGRARVRLGRTASVMQSVRNGCGRPLLLVHGLGGNHRSWDTILSNLVAQRDGVALAPMLPFRNSSVTRALLFLQFSAQPSRLPPTSPCKNSEGYSRLRRSTNCSSISQEAPGNKGQPPSRIASRSTGDVETTSASRRKRHAAGTSRTGICRTKRRN